MYSIATFLNVLLKQCDQFMPHYMREEASSFIHNFDRVLPIIVHERYCNSPNQRMFSEVQS
jgi:hypothetical protein